MKLVLTTAAAAALLAGAACATNQPADEAATDSGVSASGSASATASPAARSSPAPAPRPSSAGAAQTQGGATAGATAPAPQGHAREEAALRRLIAELQTGSVNYSLLAPHLAEAMRAQQAAMTARMAPRGPVQRIEHLGAGDNGVQRFGVVYANETSVWELSVDPNGVITGLVVKD